jgi:hypothetical protein
MCTERAARCAQRGSRGARRRSIVSTGTASTADDALSTGSVEADAAGLLGAAIAGSLADLDVPHMTHEVARPPR